MKLSTLRIFSPLAVLLSISMVPLHADDEPVAKVGDTEISADEIRTSLAALDPKQRQAFQQNPSLLAPIVRTLLVQKLVVKEAVGKKWDQKPEVVAQINLLKERAVLESYIQSVSQPPADYPSNDDVSAVYNANKAALVIPKQYRLAQIYISTSKSTGSTSSAEAKLDEVKAALKKAGADFSQVAAIYSEEASSREKGGEIGWLTEPQIVPELRSQAVALRTGEVSAPIKMDDGYHVLKMLEIKESYTPTLDEARAVLVQQMRIEKTRANAKTYLEKLVQQSPVAVNEIALSKILK